MTEQYKKLLNEFQLYFVEKIGDIANNTAGGEGGGATEKTLEVVKTDVSSIKQFSSSSNISLRTLIGKVSDIEGTLAEMGTGIEDILGEQKITNMRIESIYPKIDTINSSLIEINNNIKQSNNILTQINNKMTGA